MTTVTLATNRLQIFEDGVLKDSITYIGIDSINPLTDVRSSSNYGTVMMGPPGTITKTSQWKVELVMRDGRVQTITLGNVGGQASWTNNAAGFANAEAAIYAAL